MAPGPEQVAPVDEQHHGMPEGHVEGNNMQPEVSQPLQMTQMLGSEVDHNVLLAQPKAHIIARAKMPRGDRLVRLAARGSYAVQ